MLGAREKRRRNFALSLVLMALLGVTAFACAAAADTARVTEFRLPIVPSYPRDLVAGPDGDMWFAATQVHNFVRPGEGEAVQEIDRISADGQIGPVASPQPASALTPGPEDSVWFVNGGGIGRLMGDGHVTEFPLQTNFPTTNTVPGAITDGPDGNLWFTGLHYLGNVGGPPESIEVVGRMTPAGQVSEFPLPGKELGPFAITAGPDGNVWFTESNANKIGRITPSGQITEFAIPTDGAHPSDIVVGPDGNVWFTEQRLRPPAAIGRIDPSGQITEFPLSSASAYPGQIVVGPDGRLWFTYGVGAIGTISPRGEITRVELPHDTQLDGIAAGPESSVWYTADGDPPCMGGGSSCMMQIPQEPGIVGRVEPAQLSVEIGSRLARARGGWARLRLSCNGGKADAVCRGIVSLSIRIKVHSGGRGQTMSGSASIARRHYAIAVDESRTISLRLRSTGLSLLRRHPQLRVNAAASARGGESASERVVLVKSAAHHRDAHRQRR